MMVSAIVSGLENQISAAIYAKVNERVELCTKIFYYALTNFTTPGIMAPKFVISFYLYFSTDLGEDAFSLPYPVW